MLQFSCQLQLLFYLHSSFNCTIRNTIHNSICGCIQFRSVKWYIFVQLLSVLSKKQELLVLHFSCSQLPILPHGHLTFLHCVLHSLLTPLPILPHGQLCKLLTLAIIKPPSWERKNYNVLPKWTSYNASVNKRVETAPIPMSYLKKAQGFDAHIAYVVCNPARWVQACTHRSEADNQPRAGLDWVSGVLVINASTKPPSRRDNTTQHNTGWKPRWWSMAIRVGQNHFLPSAVVVGQNPQQSYFVLSPKQ